MAFMALTVLAATFTGEAAATPRKLALLIGVGQYADQRIPALEGPAHDIDALQSVLRQHWGFAPGDITVLRDRAATRSAILGAIAALEQKSAAGDQLFIYFSGHGTSAGDRTLSLPLPHASGAFVPYDATVDAPPAEIVGRLIVGARDLRPLLARLDAGGRQVLVVSDSCYSGQAVRMLGALPGVRLQPRHLPIASLAALAAQEPLLSSRAAAGATATGAPGKARGRPEPEPYPYRHVFYIAAASDSEPAVDIGSQALAKLPTIDNRPHGALTDALLRALGGHLPHIDTNRDGAVEHGELYAAVQRFMAARAYPHVPQSLPAAHEDSARLARQAVFGAAGVPGSSMAGGGAGDGGPPPAPVQAEGTGALPGVAGGTGGVAGAAAAVSGTLAAAPAATPLRVRLQDLPEAPAALREGVEAQWLGADAPGDADFTLEARALPWRLRSPAGDLVLEAAGDAAAAAAHVRRRLAASAWLRRLQAAAHHPGRERMTLEMQPVPATRGGTFVEGETFTLALRAERAAFVLVLVVDAEGRVAVLYPFRGEEGRRHVADAVVQTPPPASPLRVAAPFGTDELLAVAFEQAPEWWPLLPVKDTLPPAHPLLAGLARALRPAAEGGAAGAVGLAMTPLRSVPRPR